MKQFSIALALLALNCTNSPEAASPQNQPYDPGIFTFAPQEGREYLHTMHRRDELRIVGTPMNAVEEWNATFHVTIARESNLYVLQAELVELTIHRNGATMLQGDEIKDLGARLDIAVDPQGKVVDIRRTETITKALGKIVPPEAQGAIQQMFSPQNLTMLFVARANERTFDLVGRSARVGEKWEGVGATQGSGQVTRTLEVKKIEPCGKEQCVRVEREITIDPQLVWQGARQKVDNYLKSQGREHGEFELLEANVDLKDKMFVNPHSLEFHGATFSQKSHLSVEGPQGKIQVEMSTLRESTYVY